MSFRYPLILLLIPIVFILLHVAKRSIANIKRLYFPIAHRNFKPSSFTSWASIVPFALRYLAIVCFILAMARPVTSSSETRRQAEGIDIMITFDVSQSMMIEDMGEDNRLHFAKKTVKHFIEGRTDDRIGFLIFSGEAVTLCPPTLDYQALLESVDMADINMLKDGTAIGDALATSVNRLKDSKAKSKVIILATDGDSNVGSIAPLTAGEIAAGYGIKVYSIAMGREGIVNLPVTQNIFGINRKSYQQVQSTINPNLLMKISSETGGKFFRAEDAGALERVFEEINRLEKTKVETKDKILWEEHFQIFILIGLLIIFTEMILRYTIFRVLPG